MGAEWTPTGGKPASNIELLIAWCSLVIVNHKINIIHFMMEIRKKCLNHKFYKDCSKQISKLISVDKQRAWCPCSNKINSYLHGIMLAKSSANYPN